MTAPHHGGQGVGIVSREVMLGNLGGQAPLYIPLILIRQGEPVIFAMSGDEHLPCIPGGDNSGSRRL